MALARLVCLLVMLGFAATAAALGAQRASDPIASVGDGLSDAVDHVDGAGDAVGADKVASGAGGAVSGTANTVGGAGSSVGADPNNIQHVPVVGGNFKVDAMSTSLSCVINLTIQYFLVYTAFAIVTTFADALNWNVHNMKIGDILEQAILTVNYAPMLACLFLACRMRVNYLTQGKGNPPTHIQVCMLCCTYAVLLMTLVAIVVPVFTGTIVPHDDKGHVESNHQPFENKCLAILFTVLKYIILVFLYVGAVIIIVGINNYVPPPGSWPEGEIPPPAPAVVCTMILTSMYFIVYAFIQACATFCEFWPSFEYISKIKGALDGAVCTMAFAPMLSILFIGARMRALQMDPIHGHPQRWAQNCFYACTYAVMLQCALAITIPLVMGGTVKKGKRQDRHVEGDVEYEVNHRWCGMALEVIRWIIMIAIYVGFTCVIWSIFTIQHPAGAEYTPPISVTMQCVINLTVQYFAVYLLIWVCITVKECTGWDWHYISNAMEQAKGTVAFCPMLAILFVGTRMRALRLTNNRGAPQGWVQDGMYMATWSILIQFMMVLLIPIATFIMSGGKQVEHAKVDGHGNTHWKPEEEHKGTMAGKIMLLVVEIVRWLGFALLYGGTITVIVGAIMMTPETANGRGSLPLVRQTPVGQEPKGLNDAPGMPAEGSSTASDSTYSF